MQQIISKNLAGGMHLTIVPSNKFKTSVMSVCLVLPLGGKAASAHAALPRVLRRGTAQYPDMQTLGAVLDELYGARVEPFVRKRGECLTIGLNADVVDEKYVTGGSGLTARTTELLVSFLKTPYLYEGKFSADYTAGERENLADRIESLKNDPRSYAVRRLHEEMCRGEGFGLSEFGTLAGARALTPDSLFGAYERALAGACIELFYCGSMPPEQVEQAFVSALGRRAEADFTIPRTEVLAKPKAEPRTVVEEMNVQQGKLSLGFRTGVTGDHALYPAMMLFNNAFGGSTSSRLFLNVREKLSLCYYASSTIDKQKGILSVASGIENENFEVAREEILKQLADMQAGNVRQEEVESARRTVQSALRAMQDSPMSLLDFWVGQSIAGFAWGLDDLMGRLASVTREQVIEAAKCVQLDTIYFLKGVGA